MTILRKDGLEPLVGVQIIGEERLDLRKVVALLHDGTWTKADLDKYGLVIPEAFVVPEGKERIGEPTYVDDKGTVREVYEVQDRLPPPPDPGPPTPVERLADIGLTPADLVAMIDAERAKTAPVVR